MAKKFVHGAEIGTIDYLQSRKVYMGDGKVLEDTGEGLRAYASVKKGLTPFEAYKTAQKNKENFYRDNPHFANYAKFLMQYGIKRRVLLHSAVKDFSGDPDGLRGDLEECLPYNLKIHLTIDESVEVCRLYQLMISEAEEKKSQKN